MDFIIVGKENGSMTYAASDREDLLNNGETLTDQTLNLSSPYHKDKI